MSRVISQFCKLSLLSVALALPSICSPGAYVVADESFPDIRTHPHNFDGNGGELSSIRVCLDIGANQALAESAEPALLKAIATINRFRSLAEQTKALSAQTDVPSGQYDFESVLLHEMLHGQGLAHPNHASESGLPSPLNDGTKSANGPNNVFDQGAGVDGLHGSSDDVRGDDQNLHWYGKGVNNPGLLPSIIDESTYARSLSFLPAGHLYAANAGQQVLAALGFANAEAVMQQGAGADEAQRHLQHDDLATLRFTRAGLDGVQGTADDYRTLLVYRGRVVNPQGVACSIAVRFDNSTGFATTSLGSFRLSTATPNHWALFEARIRFNPAVNWYMSPGPNTVTTIISDLPDSSSLLAPITVRAQVVKTAGNPIAALPKGLVEVRDGPRHEATTAFCTMTLLGTPGEIGECILTPLRTGNKTLVADYLGYGGFDGGSDSETHISTGAVEFSAINDTPDPSVNGAPITLSWTLAPPAGNPAASATGTVTVKEAVDCASAPIDPAHQCTVTLPGNSCAISFNSVGNKTLQLCYSGDGAHPAAMASTSHLVNAGRATTTSISSNLPNPSLPLAPVVVQLNVRETPDLGDFPSGAVQVLDGPASDPLTARCSVALVGTAAEVGSCTLQPLRAGTRSLTASYSASGIWAASQVSATQAVANFAIVRNMPATSRLRQGVHITVDLDVSSFLSTPAPTGTITVSDGVDQCLIVLPANQCFWSASTSGARNLIANWPGDANYAPRTSIPVVQTVLPESYPVLISNPRLGYSESNGASVNNALSLSGDGRFVVFASSASDLVLNDSNALRDIFIRDQRSGLVRRISTSAGGLQSDGASAEPVISANGRFVAFSSLASNLVSGDTNNVVDVFVKDLSDGSIVRATLKSNGNQDSTPNTGAGFDQLAPSLSADGRFVAFQTGGQLLPSDTSIHNDIYVRDLLGNTLDIVSSNSADVLGDFRSFNPVLSADGRYVAFQSQAFNFYVGDSNDTVDIFRKDRLTRAIQIVSVDAAGVGGANPTDPSFGRPAISADGRYVAFSSLNRRLVVNDVNNNYDVFLKDMNTGAIAMVSTNSTGVYGVAGSQLASMSSDARYIAFYSSANNLVPGDTNVLSDIFLKDRQTNATTRINVLANGTQTLSGLSEFPAISADGRFISYQSAATDLVANDSNAQVDIFVRDRLSVASVRASAANPGARSEGASMDASISRDGRFVSYSSASSTLINGDTNLSSDVFLTDRNDGSNIRISQSASAVAANAASDFPTVSGDGLSVVFRSTASNLVASDGNGAFDVFVKQRVTGTIDLVSSSSAGTQISSTALRAGTSISSDGNLVIFHSADSTLVAGDNNLREDVFLKNRSTNATTIISTNAAGGLGDGNNLSAQISDDASRVAFVSESTNLIASDSNGVRDIYVKTLSDGTLVRVSISTLGAQANAASDSPALSHDGRFVAFSSAASNLVAGDSNGVTDIFVRDLTLNTTTRVSTDAGGAEGLGGDCSAPSISSNGRNLGFVCAMTNLVSGDSNGLADAFVKDQVTGTIARGSMTELGTQANALSTMSARAISDTGELVFSSDSSNLIAANNDALSDVFLNRYTLSAPIATTNTIITHAPNPSPRDQAYLVQAEVLPSSGNAPTTGSMRISDGTDFCEGTMTNGTGLGQCLLTPTTVGAKTLTATFSGDLRHGASVSPAVIHTVLPIVPRAPNIGTATAGNGEVRLSFIAPSDNGGAAIIGYTVTCGASSIFSNTAPVTVTGLANGVPVSCTVIARNSVGDSVASQASNSVTPGGQTLVGPFAYVPRNNTGQMAVLDLGTNSITHSISGGAGIGAAVAPNGLRAYAIDQASNSVKVINTATKTLITSIAVGAGPWSGVVSANSTRLYVSNRNASTVSVIDTASNTVLATFGVAAAPTGLAVTPDGSKLYVGSANTTNVSVVSLPGNVVTQVNVATTSHALAISPDGSRVYFVNGQATGRLTALNTATDTIVGSASIGNTPLAVNVSSDGTRIYASNFNGLSVSQIDAASLSVLATGSTGGKALGVDIHPNGSRVYVGNNNGTMTVLETLGMTTVATINMGGEATDLVYAIGNFIARTSTPPVSRKLAVGAITLPATGAGANAATRVFFPQPFSATPIVIVQPDNTDADPKAVRLSNINASSFDVSQVEPQGCAGCTGAGGTMSVHWLAALPGSYRLPNDVAMRGLAPNVPGTGVLVKVGSVLSSASQRATTFGGFAGYPTAGWETVNFPTLAGFDFSATPVVLSTLQSWGLPNEGSNLNVPALPGIPALNGVSRIWLTTAIRNASSSGFEAALESSSSDDTGGTIPGLLNPETIGYIAIESGVSTQLAVSGGSLVGLATSASISSANVVNGSCSIIDLAFPAGTATVAANLRGFAGLMSRGEDDGGWLRRCALGNASGTNVSMTVRVDEDADLSSDRSHTTLETVGTAIFGGEFATTPVSLAFVNTTRSGTQLNVQFGSATEAGHLGYRLWGRADSTKDWRALHEDLIVNRTGDGMSAKSYQRTVEAAGITEIRLEDIDLTGVSRFHPEIKPDANGAASVGAPALDQPLNWAAIRASNAATPVRSARGTAATSVLASVRKTGIQRVSFAQMSAAGFASGVNTGEIAVIENSVPVPRFVDCLSATFGPGCSVEWLASTRPSLYGSERVYEIKHDAAAAQNVGSGAVVDGAVLARTVSAEIKQAPNREYTFSAPGNDPWFDQRLVATTAPVALTRSFSLPARTVGAVNLKVNLWGGLDYPGNTPDHSVALLLNGETIAERRFDGLSLQTITLSLSAAQLQANNTLTLRVLGDTGYAADVVLLDGFSVSYTRSTSMSDGELAFGSFSANSAGDALMRNSFESVSGFALTGINTASTIWSQVDGTIKRDQVAANAALDLRVSAAYVSDLAHLQTPALAPAAAPQIDFAPVDYLIVTHPLFEAELAPIIALQQSRGYSVKVMRTDAIYAASSAHQRSPQAIREAIAQVNPKFVLLVGGDSYDYDDNLGAGSQSYLPTFYRVASLIVRFAASDALFADANSDGIPERALGRIPARTVEELRRAISSIVQRGDTPAAKFFASAGGSNASEHFAVHSRALLSYLRQNQTVEFGLSDEIGINDARISAKAALAGGSDWINYLGHSSPNRWAAQNLLDTTQLASLQRSGLPAIVSQWGCWNSYFVMPNLDTMSHALMLRSNQLAAAVIGSTSLAEDASHLALGTRFFDLIEDGRIDDRGGVAINTLGESLQAAKADLATNAPEHMESNYSITLFGDPAMRVR